MRARCIVETEKAKNSQGFTCATIPSLEGSRIGQGQNRLRQSLPKAKSAKSFVFQKEAIGTSIRTPTARSDRR
jgi:hypothetical protein